MSKTEEKPVYVYLKVLLRWFSWKTNHPDAFSNAASDFFKGDLQSAIKDPSLKIARAYYCALLRRGLTEFNVDTKAFTFDLFLELLDLLNSSETDLIRLTKILNGDLSSIFGEYEGESAFLIELLSAVRELQWSYSILFTLGVPLNNLDEKLRGTHQEHLDRVIKGITQPPTQETSLLKGASKRPEHASPKIPDLLIVALVAYNKCILGLPTSSEDWLELRSENPEISAFTDVSAILWKLFPNYFLNPLAVKDARARDLVFRSEKLRFEFQILQEYFSSRAGDFSKDGLDLKQALQDAVVSLFNEGHYPKIHLAWSLAEICNSFDHKTRLTSIPEGSDLDMLELTAMRWYKNSKKVKKSFNRLRKNLNDGASVRKALDKD